MMIRVQMLAVVVIVSGLIDPSQTPLSARTGSISTLIEYVNTAQTQNFLSNGDVLEAEALASVQTVAGDPYTIFF